MHRIRAAALLLLQLAAVRFFDPLGGSAMSPEINQETRLNDLLLLFWPPNSENRCVTWPPPHSIQSSQLEEVADRFQELRPT